MENRSSKILQTKNESFKAKKGPDWLVCEPTFLTPSPSIKIRTSHYKLIPHSRIPNKNFHFHEKTYESTFLPKVIFKSSTRINRSEMLMTSSPKKYLNNDFKQKKILKRYIIPAYYPYSSLHH